MKIIQFIIFLSVILLSSCITRNNEVISDNPIVLREGLDKQLNVLPETNGAALVFDDTNERLFPIQTRPRITWHGGSSPSAIPEKKKLFEF